MVVTMDNSRKIILAPLLRLTGLLIIAQCWIVSLSAHSTVGKFPIKKFFFERVVQSTVALEQVVLFIVVQVAIYGLLILAIYNITRTIGKFFKFSHKRQRNLGIVIWLVVFISIYLANVFYFPNSRFAEIKQFVFNDNLLLAHRLFQFSLIFIAGILMLYCVINYKATLIVITVSALGYFFSTKEISHTVSNTKPNIIIIGIDSLRPDHLNFTPSIKTFINDAQVYPHAYTPLARTFPAWVSILTGKYPAQHGARFNLTEKNSVDFQSSIATTLQKNGYETVLATDERRFSNIDKDYGFNKIIGPELGVNDFLLGFINDFPLSNLLLNTFIGAKVFGFTGYNRAAATTYNPKQFTQQVIRFIKAPHPKPTFLAIHLCLPHWPYSWANSAKNPMDEIHYSHHLYKESLKQVDHQFKTIVNNLNDSGMLDNTLVFVISDHGDGFAEIGDRLTQEQNYVPNRLPPKRLTHLAASIGHGTDILSPSQYRILFAMKNFGHQLLPHGVNHTAVSLVDIAPTIADYLQLENKPKGSLLGHINPQRSIFIETGLTSRILHTKNPKMAQLLSENINFYEIDKDSGYLYLKPQATKFLIPKKQIAIIQFPWFLTQIQNSTNHQDNVLANLATDQWTDDLTSVFASQAPLTQLQTALDNVSRH